MRQSTETSFETNTQAPDFQQQIDAITDRSLTPENIDTYADGALDDLVAVIDTMTSLYDQQPIVAQESNIQRERAAFSYYGLEADQIELTLDHIADVAEGIHGLDSLIEQLTSGGEVVITPPDLTETNVTSGGGSFREKEIIPRLKTILLILQHEFGIDISGNDPEQFRFIPGKVEKHMMREQPYHVIDLPELNRVIDVCDEEGNRTFVFDRQKMLALGYDTEAIATMEKSKIDTLIKSGTTSVIGVIYNSKTFVERLSNLLNDAPIRDEKPKNDYGEESGRLLKPRVDYLDHKPDGYATCEEVALLIGRSQSGVRSRIRQLRADTEKDFGDIAWWKQDSKTLKQILSPRQIDMIRGDDIVLLDHLPTGYITVLDMAEKMGLSFNGLDQRLANLAENDDFGLVEYCRRPESSNKLERILSPKQQNLLTEGEGNIVTEIPEGYVTLGQFASMLGLQGKFTAHSRITKKKQKGAVFDFLRFREKGRKGRPQIILSPSEQQLLLLPTEQLKYAS